METIHLTGLLKSDKGIFANKICELSKSGQHMHDYIELQYILSGSGVHKIGEAQIPVKADDVFFTNCGTPHCFVSDGDNPIELINCCFMPELIINSAVMFNSLTSVAVDVLYKTVFPDEYAQKPFIYVYGGAQNMRSLFLTVYNEYQNSKMGSAGVMLGCLLQILVYFTRLYQKQNLNNSAVYNAKTEYVNTVLRYIQKHYSTKISLDELAKSAFLSPNHLCKVFKDITGTTMSEYIQKIRVEKACELLKTTNSNTDKIAESVGYDDASQFRRVFKKAVGVSPSVYRINITEE